MTPTERFIKRFQEADFQNEEAHGQLSSVILAIDTYNERGRGREFDAILINLATTYPEDQDKILALFEDVPEKLVSPIENKATKSPYLKKTKKQEGTCDSCDDDPEKKITYGEYQKMGEKERKSLGLSEETISLLGSKPGSKLSVVGSGVQVNEETPEIDKDLSDCKTPGEVLAFFSNGGTREYVETTLAMKSFCSGMGIELGRKSKAESIAEAILEVI